MQSQKEMKKPFEIEAFDKKLLLSQRKVSTRNENCENDLISMQQNVYTFSEQQDEADRPSMKSE